MSLTPQERIITALDVPDTDQARTIIDAIGAAGSFYKIGYQLIPIGGLDLARELSANGKKTFLDFKFHDIGATVERGVRSIARLGADFLTVHAEPDVLKGAVQGRECDPRLKILAVTVLTSLSQESLGRMGISTPIETLVLERAEMALEAGVDGVVASAREASAIRKRFGDDFAIVTPGIRPAGSDANDQKRVVTPADAIRNGSDYLVIGRPIVGAPDKRAAIEAIVRDIQDT